MWITDVQDRPASATSPIGFHSCSKLGESIVRLIVAPSNTRISLEIGQIVPRCNRKINAFVNRRSGGFEPNCILRSKSARINHIAYV